jgi:hypothetical protein
MKSIAEQRIDCVSEQLHDYEAGRIKKIGCPYCGRTIKYGKMCCHFMAKAVKIVLDREKVRLENDFMANVSTNILRVN